MSNKHNINCKLLVIFGQRGDECMGDNCVGVCGVQMFSNHTVVSVFVEFVQFFYQGGEHRVEKISENSIGRFKNL
jgi:hypothetical protein